MSNNEYTKRLENVIKQMLQPLKDIPFNLVIESMTGKKVIKIDTFYHSSKTCHICGKKNENLKLSDREWTCKHCGTTHDRDINASINILNEGLRISGMVVPSTQMEAKIRLPRGEAQACEICSSI